MKEDCRLQSFFCEQPFATVNRTDPTIQCQDQFCAIVSFLRLAQIVSERAGLPTCIDFSFLLQRLKGGANICRIRGDILFVLQVRPDFRGGCLSPQIRNHLSDQIGRDLFGGLSRTFAFLILTLFIVSVSIPLRERIGDEFTRVDYNRITLQSKSLETECVSEIADRFTDRVLCHSVFLSFVVSEGFPSLTIIMIDL